MPAIIINTISKSYGDVPALREVSFNVAEGELFGLIGPDGAGKSTLFRILTTLLLADKGEGYVVGHHVVNEYKEIRKKVGYMPGRFSLYQDLSVEENLSFFATIFGTTIQENYDLVKDIYVQLEPFKTRPAGKLSGGMKQKLALCCSLIHRPEVLFLDEPTTGVDAVSRVEFWDMLQKLKQKGIAILVSTPYMDEATRCDRIALIQKGRILSIDSPQQIINDFKKPLFAIKTNATYKMLKALREAIFTASVLPFGENIHLITTSKMTPEEVKVQIGKLNVHVEEVTAITATVEDVFLELSSLEEPIEK